MFDQLVGGYDTLIGADPDVQALIGAQYLSGAGQLNPSVLAALRGSMGHPAAPQRATGIAPGALQALMQVAQNQQRNDAIAQAAQQIGDPVVVQPQSCMQARYLPAGFEATAVGAGLSATITVRPQCLFRADRLVIPYTGNGQYFTITAFSIGQTNLLVGSGPVPAGVFSENATGMIRGLGLPTNQPVQEITLIVKNNDAAARDLRGAFEGRAVF